MFEWRRKPTLDSWGLAGTFIYFAVVLWIVYSSGIVNVGDLDLNEFGDLMAGVFGPPALIWVVISFYLQSAELRNSVDALLKQADQLKKSNDQQSEIAAINRKQLRFEKEIKTLELSLQIANADTDIDVMFKEIQPLIVLANHSRRALLAAVGMFESGRMDVWEDKYQVYLSKFEELSNEFKQLTSSKSSADDLNSLTSEFAKYYRVKSETNFLLQRLENEISSDDDERNQRRADNLASLN